MIPTTFLAIALFLQDSAGWPGRDWPIALAPENGFALGAAPLVEVGLHLPAAGPEVYEVVRLTRVFPQKAWRLADVSRGAGDRLLVRGPAGAETLLLLRTSAHPGYLLDGPFRWPAQPSTYVVETRWRRTVRGRGVRARSGAVAWVPAVEEPVREGWPSCSWKDDEEWECIGVPLTSTGVVFMSEETHLRFGVAIGVLTRSGIEDVAAEAAAWGGLVIAEWGRDDLRQSVALRATALRIAAPHARPHALRLDVASDPRVRIVRVGAGAFWIAGKERVEDTWIEVTGKGFAPVRIDVTEVAGSRPDLPLHVTLDRAVEVRGRVTAGPDVPASGANVTLFRFVPVGFDPKREPRRLLVREVTADEDGAFVFDDLGLERYEIVAMHPSLGRADRRFDPDGQEIEIVLRRPAQAVGRVTRDGAPAAGIRVTVVPDLVQFAASEDVTTLRGGETTTDQDGRFAVSLPLKGAGEVRIGDDATGVRRVPYAAAGSLPPVVDIGAIELGARPSVTMVLEGSEGCELMLVGPSGRAGMNVVRATRLGPAMFNAGVPEDGRWTVSAICNGRERAVVPGSIDVPAGVREVTVRLVWP